MKKSIFLIAVLGIVVLSSIYAKKRIYDVHPQKENSQKENKSQINNDQIQNGDLIFQSSMSGQSHAVQIATRSKYSHCGIIYKEGADYFVYEAVQPVKRTPLQTWIEHGDDEKYVIKRLKNAEQVLTPEVIKKMKSVGNTFMGKDYDLTFEWSDDRIYCSEFIWKIYKRGAGIEIGKLEKLKDFNLSDPLVQKIMNERYGKVIPLEETVISPASIFACEQLKTVMEH